MNNYYIYIYLDSRSPGKYCYENFSLLYKPIYVGKGKNNRWKKINKYDRSDYFINKINKIKKSGLEPIVIKLYENLNEKELLKKEIELINEINIKNPGILINFTNGGEGISGYKFLKEIREIIAVKQRKDFSEIKKEFERRDYILLSEEKDYKNNKTILEYICPKGHKGFISWTNFQQGKGCPVEGNELGHKKERKNFSEIKNEFEKRDYILLTEEKDYKNNKTILEYICPKGHKDLVSWTSFQQGCGCPICYNENKRGENNINNKLSNQDVYDIQKSLELKLYTPKQLSWIFDISISQISKIKTGKIWSHIKLGGE